jgi:hypothetical protein
MRGIAWLELLAVPRLAVAARLAMLLGENARPEIRSPKPRRPELSELKRF